MSTFSDWVRWTHVVAGSLALVTFWLPWAVRKGGVTHRRAGWLYSGAMTVVSGTAFISCALRLVDPDPGNDGPALFLAYVGLLSLVHVVVGLQAVRRARRAPGRWLPAALPGMLLFGGLALLGYSLATRAMLPGAFALLGVFLALRSLRDALWPSTEPRAWLLAHLRAMGTACIGTVTAFVVVNARAFELGVPTLVVWLAPGVLGGVVLSLWEARYRLTASARRPPVSP